MTSNNVGSVHEAVYHGIELARQLASKGYPVFPVRPGMKRPLHAGWQQEATTDPAEVDRLWADEPEANIGIATGGRLLVLDFDSAEAMRSFRSRWETPHLVHTPSGGAHAYYLLPAGLEGAVISKVRAWPDMDTRCAGGLVVAGGRTESGAYKGAEGLPALSTLTEIPADVLDLLPRNNGSSGALGAGEIDLSCWETPEVEWTHPEGAVVGTEEAFLDMLVELTALRQAPEGRRNDKLFHTSLRLAHWMLKGELDHEFAVDELQSAAAEIGLPALEVQTTIYSALQRAAKQQVIERVTGQEMVMVEAEDEEDLPVAEGVTLLTAEPRLWGYKELLEAQLPEPEWIVREFWARGGIGMLSAQPKSFKTTLAADWAIAIASGSPFLGQPVQGGPYRVLILNGEDAIVDVRSNHKRLLGGRRLGSAPDLPIAVLDLMGEKITTAKGKFLVDSAAADFRPDFIIADNFTNLARIENENDAQQVGAFLDQLKDLARRHNAGMMLIHHERKRNRGKDGKLEVDDFRQAMRGSGAFDTWWECFWSLAKVEDTKPVHLHLSRQFRSFPDPDICTLAYDTGQSGGTSFRIVRETPDGPRLLDLSGEGERGVGAPVSPDWTLDDFKRLLMEALEADVPLPSHRSRLVEALGLPVPSSKTHEGRALTASLSTWLKKQHNEGVILDGRHLYATEEGTISKNPSHDWLRRGGNWANP